jgi:hypothetical protein
VHENQHKSSLNPKTHFLQSCQLAGALNIFAAFEKLTVQLTCKEFMLELPSSESSFATIYS